MSEQQRDEPSPDEEWEWEYFDDEESEKPSGNSGGDAVEEEEVKGYTERSWKNFPMFQCEYCPFNHVSPDRDTTVIEQHVWKFHILPKRLEENARMEGQRREVSTELYDASGKLITERDATSDELAGESLLDFEPPKTLY